MVAFPLSKELKAESQRDLCTLMFIAALFTTDAMQEQPKHPSMDEWRNRMWHMQTMEYYPT